MIINYELVGDPICEVEDWGFSYRDCTECPKFYNCMEVEVKRGREVIKMSLGKAIEYKKEHRKPYRETKAISCSCGCRNHGGCSWCEANRRYKYLKKNG